MKLKIWELCLNIHGCTHTKLDEKDVQLIGPISFLGGYLVYLDAI